MLVFLAFSKWCCFSWKQRSTCKLSFRQEFIRTHFSGFLIKLRFYSCCQADHLSARSCLQLPAQGKLYCHGNAQTLKYFKAMQTKQSLVCCEDISRIFLLHSYELYLCLYSSLIPYIPTSVSLPLSLPGPAPTPPDLLRFPFPF